MDRRRTGFRLSWAANDQRSEDDAQPDEAAAEATAAAVDTMTAEAPAGETPSAEASAAETPAAETPPAETQAPTPEPVSSAQGAAPDPAAAAAGATGPDGQSDEFLVSLVGAMRGVAESSRDASLADFRTAVDTRIEELNTASAEKEAELRRAADLDLQGVGDWERDESERIKSEAETRRDARRTKLEQQLTEHRAASEREVEATRGRMADHERDLAAFFAQLGEISDPAAFVAAAKRMPHAPDLAASAATPAAAPDNGSATPADDPRLAAMGAAAGEAKAEAEATAPAETGAADATAAGATTATATEADTTTADATAADAADSAAAPTDGAEAGADDRLAARLAQLDQRINGETQPVAAAAPAPSNGGETSTAVIVKGLGSFGAITSFKQALERVEGVRGVTLSLGPTGEFVYRASHAADFDMVAAVQSVEGPSATVEDTDGTLVVTLSRAR